jgi:hypothetical protein
VHRHPRAAGLDNKRASFRAWQDRVRDPSLSVLLVLQLSLMFVALPLDALGVPIAEPAVRSLLLLVLTVVVVLSQRAFSIVIILLGLAMIGADLAFGPEWPPLAGNVLNDGGVLLVFSTLAWVVVHAVYASGRITSHRLQGAAVVYLSLASVFAALFSLVGELVPGAFANLPAETRGPHEVATMLYFSLATLTTVGYGDIVPVNPFARSLANLEAVIGQFYIAITITRLVTLEMEGRRRSRE